MIFDYRILFPVLISFIISVALSPIIIPFLKKLKFGQFVRDDGPESHLKKSGTPTMGGLIILCSFVIKRSLGLKAWQKMLGQIIITGIFAYYIVNYTDIGTIVDIPFTNYNLDLGSFYVPILFIIVIGTVNGANFTDGLDGLVSSVTVLIATFFTAVAIGLSSGLEPVTCAAVGSLLGFLVYNVYPARVFMGDTGSLALGGFVASTAYLLRMTIFIGIVGFIYLAEVVSVIIQVCYYKKTGKRIFKMAPIHHHFELSGWPETKVVAIFSIVTAILCLVALLGIN